MPEGYTIEEAKTAIDKLASAVESFKKANDLRLEEIEKKGKASPDIEEKISKIEKDIESASELKKRLDDLEVKSQRKARFGDERKGYELTDEQIERKAALQTYLRKGDDRLNDTETKALAVQSDPDGGYLVSPDTSGRIQTRIFESSPIRSLAAVQVISTDALEGLIDDDEAGFEWVGETQNRTNERTPRLGQWRIPVHELCTRPKATQKLLEDAAIDVESWLANKISTRFSRAENTAFVNGDGSSKPRGFLTYPDVSAPGAYERGRIEQIETAANDAIGFDDIIDMYYSLKGEYRTASTWAMNRRTFGVIRKLKDSDGQYLWQPSLQVGSPDSILGRPTAEFNDLPDVADGALPIALADWARAYQIVDRLGISTLRDPYSSKPYVEFYTRKRVGGDVLNFEAIKLLRIQ